MCGIGVTSLINVISSPATCRALTAASRPGPGPFTLTAITFIPFSIAAFPAASPAICAAKGVDLRDPLNPKAPALDHATAFPFSSVIVTMVLLNVEWTCATPRAIFLRALRFHVSSLLRSLPLFTSSYRPISFCLLLYELDLYAYEHLSLYAVRVLVILFCDGFHGSIRFPLNA